MWQIIESKISLKYKEGLTRIISTMENISTLLSAFDKPGGGGDYSLEVSG